MTSEMKKSFSKIEVEILTLKAVRNMLDDMLNYEVFELSHNDPNSQISFNSQTHCKYFNITMADLLAKPFFEKRSYIDLLEEICNDPQFLVFAKSMSSLSNAVSNLRSWLNGTSLIKKMWFPSINVEIDFKIKRQDIVEISGNIVKHNFSRLDRQARKLQKVFKQNGAVINEDESFLALEDFYNWSYGDGGIFSYHSHEIAELLNNLRWGIYYYLRLEFFDSRTYTTSTHPRQYKYRYPEGVKDKLVQEYYWQLMNDVREKPYMPKFEINRYLKTHYRDQAN